MEVSSVISSTTYVHHLVNIPYVHFHFFFCCFYFLFFFFNTQVAATYFLWRNMTWTSGSPLISLFTSNYSWKVLWKISLTISIGFSAPYTHLPHHLPELKARGKLNFAIQSSFKIKFHLIIFLGHYIDTPSFKVHRELAILLLYDLIKIWNIPQGHARNKKAGQHAFCWVSRQWGFQSAALLCN